jgi:hypothetical protein
MVKCKVILLLRFQDIYVHEGVEVQLYAFLPSEIGGGY